MNVIDIVNIIQDKVAEEKRRMREADINPLINDIFAVERAAIKIQAYEELLEQVRLKREEDKRHVTDTMAAGEGGM